MKHQFPQRIVPYISLTPFVLSHCESELHQPNNFEIYRTSFECCEGHFPSSSNCLEDSKNSHAPFPSLQIHFPGTDEYREWGVQLDPEDHWGTDKSHVTRWFPDLINKLNCVNGKNYENWMAAEGFDAHYLFYNAEDCCKKWWE